MIELNTGLPGEGKTLLAVTHLAKLIARWDAHPEERRDIYVYGIKELAIAHKSIEVWPEGGKRGDPVPLDVRGRPTCNLIMDWNDIADGSLVIIDECQYMFPVRGPSQKPPPHVTFLNTHRHAGLDIWLITQHPKLIDNATRRLVSKHTHIRRVFGLGRSVTYEWTYCDDQLQGMKKAVMSQFNYPKASYALYKSAEVHNKRSFKKPWWIWLPIVVVPIAAWAIPTAWDGMGKVLGGVKLTPDAPAVAKPPPKAPAPTSGGPAKPAAPQAAPAPIAPPAPAASSVPKLAGCIAAAKRCTCYGTDGVRVSVEREMCDTHTGADLLAKTGEIPAALVDRPEVWRPSDRDQEMLAWTRTREVMLARGRVDSISARTEAGQ